MMPRVERNPPMSKRIRIPLVPECSACIIGSLRIAIPLLTDDEEKRYQYFRTAYERIGEGFKKHQPPLELSILLHQELYKAAGKRNPYAPLKKQSIDSARLALPSIEEKVNRYTGYDKLRAALAAAITGNVIDYNVAGHDAQLENLESLFNDIMSVGFAIDDSKSLWNTLNSHKGKVLFLADNAGESYFDIPLLHLIKDFGWNLTYVVKGEAMINDATRGDIQGSEIEDLATIEDTGAWAHGVPKKWVSTEFLNSVRNSNLVISKGQANIESFPEIQEEVDVETYYVTRGKCPHISRIIGARKGNNIVLRRPSLAT